VTRTFVGVRLTLQQVLLFGLGSVIVAETERGASDCCVGGLDWTDGDFCKLVVDDILYIIDLDPVFVNVLHQQRAGGLYAHSTSSH